MRVRQVGLRPPWAALGVAAVFVVGVATGLEVSPALRAHGLAPTVGAEDGSRLAADQARLLYLAGEEASYASTDNPLDSVGAAAFMTYLDGESSSYATEGVTGGGLSGAQAYLVYLRGEESSYGP